MRLSYQAVTIALLVVGGACQSGTLVSTRLVDPRPSDAWYGWPLYLVVVHQSPLAPIAGLDRLWKRLEQVDTVPNIRTLGSIVIVGDTMVVGVGGFSQIVFQYDIRTKSLARAPLPDWLNAASFTPPPAFAPQGRYIAYLAQLQDGSVRLAVRSWPNGQLIGESAPVHQRHTLPVRGAILWQNAEQLHAGFPVSDSGHSWARLEGRVTSGRIDVAWMISVDPTPDVALAPSIRANGQVDRATLARRFAEAERQIPRLEISVFRELPAAFARELTEAGCVVPQSYGNPRPHNVIHGTFAAPQQLDWAALCLRGDESVVVVWWGGAVRCPRELEPAKNRNYLQTIDEGRVGFSRAVSTTDFYNNYEGETDSTGAQLPSTVKLEHDAIEISFLDKASTIWVCRGGRWISFPGAD